MENKSTKQDKIKLAATIAACVIFIIGASVLYSRLQQGSQKELITEAPSSFESEADNSRNEDAGTQSEDKKDDEGTSEPSPAPDFAVEDPEGNTVYLSDFKGTPVIINVWASWCPPCKSEMPLFDEKAKEYDGKIQFMMINLTAQDELEDAKAFIADSGYTFPVFYDINNDVGQKYYTPGIPATFFVDADGNAAAYITGAIDEATLEKGIEMIGITG